MPPARKPPNISPAKTWEGVLGGQLTALAVIAVLHWGGFSPWEISPAWYLVAMITASVSVVGDLFISLLKRQVGVKDTGALIPGHGGILDRFDSAFAAAPIFAGGLALEPAKLLNLASQLCFEFGVFLLVQREVTVFKLT